MFERGFKSWCENTAIQIRKDLKLAAIDPLSARDLAASLTIPLWTPSDVGGLSAEATTTLHAEQTGWSALTISHSGRDAIIFNPAHSTRRQSTDIMHELAHLLMRHDPAKMIFSSGQDAVLRTYDKKQEDEADWLSGCLLLPRPALLTIVSAHANTETALERYGVSQTLFNYRMNVTGVRRQVRSQKH